MLWYFIDFISYFETLYYVIFVDSFYYYLAWYYICLFPSFLQDKPSLKMQKPHRFLFVCHNFSSSKISAWFLCSPDLDLMSRISNPRWSFGYYKVWITHTISNRSTILVYRMIARYSCLSCTWFFWPSPYLYYSLVSAKFSWLSDKSDFRFYMH